jgi:FtsP/CotA-like multicopper oxidase with cupredoxin domain
MLVNNTDGGEHPWHLHGYDFWVVATSAAPELEQTYAPHYVRRDVVSVPGFGWAKLRFVADNPGIWVMHCHIGANGALLWRPASSQLTASAAHADIHMHAGMVGTFIVAPSEIARGAAEGWLKPPANHLAACSAPPSEMGR